MAASLTADLLDASAADPPILSGRRKLAIFLVMAIGQFMALLDIQIVVSSQGAIQAGLSAAADEIDWLQTAYLMAEIVMIPLSAYLAEALSTRWMFILSAGLFTLASLMCGAAWDLPSMIAFRAVQGFVGGAMIPLVFATGFSFFGGGRERAAVTGLLGVISTLAPTIGPSVGGWITETIDWRWLFYINVAPGIMVTLALVFLGRFDRARPLMLAHIDWLHVASLAVFLGGMQFVLEEGPGRQWFEDPQVSTVTWFVAVAAAVFFERCLYSPKPIVRLGVLRNRGFWAAAVLSFVIGLGIYTITYLTPVFLARVRDFTSLEIGDTVFVAGVFMTLAAPVAAALATRFDMRLVMAAGLALYGVSFWMISGVTREWGFDQLFWPQAVRGVALILCIVPSVGMALTGVEDEALRDASGLINLMRNLGGTIGIALVNTGLIGFFNVHFAQLSAGLGRAPAQAEAALQGLTAKMAAEGADLSSAPLRAAGAIGQLVSQEALAEAFRDVFRLIAYLFFIAVLVVPLCRGGPMRTEPQHHH